MTGMSTRIRDNRGERIEIRERVTERSRGKDKNGVKTKTREQRRLTNRSLGQTEASK